MSREARGAFITVEGIEGVGKSSSLETIERCLCSLGRRVLRTREPGGTVLGERVREWILHGEHGAISAEVEALLMFAARAHHLREVIAPALAEGRWVVCDRFTDATYAYQGGGRGLPSEFLDCLTANVQRGLEPDLTLLLDAPVEIGRARISGREHDHFEREDRDFFERVRAAYLRRASASPERVKIVDASRTPKEVGDAIEQHLRSFASKWK